MKRTTVRATAAAAFALSLGAGLSACGSSNNDDNSASDNAAPAAAATTSAAPITNTTVGLANGRILPGLQADPVPNQVKVDGAAGTLTDVTVNGTATDRADSFLASVRGHGITVADGSSGETRGFQNLCIGAVDIVDSSRPISPAEWAQCRADGLDIVQFQVAADAVVVAIKSETDVGTDCLSTDQVAQAFGHGATANTWSDLDPDWDNVPLRVGGPTVASNVSQFFGRYVLQDPEPINSDFRTGYIHTRDENATKTLVTGISNDRKTISEVANFPRVNPKFQQLKSELAVQWKWFSDASQQVKDAQADQLKGIRTHRSVKDRAADNARVAEAFTNRGNAITAVHLAQSQLRKVLPRYRIAAAAEHRAEIAKGTAGIFSEGYYATWENQLRPFEIQINDGTQRQNCIFPSPQTILNGEYPLSRQLLLTTTTRALKRPEVQYFLEYYLAHSQANAVRQGVVPLPNKDVDQQLAWIEKGPLPKFASVNGGPVLLQTAPTKVAPVAPVVVSKPDNPAR